MKRLTKEAIALEYGQQDSPTVLAKGSEDLAVEIIEEAKKHDIFIAEDPLRAVVRGTGTVLKNIERYKSVLIK